MLVINHVVAATPSVRHSIQRFTFPPLPFRMNHTMKIQHIPIHQHCPTPRALTPPTADPPGNERSYTYLIVATTILITRTEFPQEFLAVLTG